jgi:hypothetical protein
MEEYIDENGNLYTVDEINKTAKEYNTNFQDIIKKNKLSLKSKKQEKVKAVKAEEPGKPKPVVKEDVPAAVKSTASKLVKPSSASRTNLWGEDKSQPEFVTNLQKQAKTLVPKTKDVFNPKKFAKEVTSVDTDGFYAKGEKNIQKSGVKEKKLEADIVDNVFNNFETLNYAKLTPEQKLDIDDQAVQILQAKQPVGTPYNIQPADIELKAQEILTKASDKKNKIIGESYIDRLLDGVAKGADYVGESFASIPETVYRVFAAPQNIYAAIAGDKNLEVTPEKFKKSMGVTNPIMDYFIDEQKRIGKKNNIYDNANYDSQSITENISNGNYSDAFRLLGSGLAESAPVSIGIMASGANMSIAKLAAASTAAMAGPEIRAQIEEKPGQSEIENVITGFGMAGAESVFSAIGEGSIGKVYKDIILKEGVETGAKIFKDGLITTYQTALKKYGVPVAMVGEGLEEVATKVTQNLISKKPAFEGTMDSFVAGVGGGTVYGSPITLQKSIEGFKTGVTTYKVNKQLKDSGIANIKEAFDPNTPITEGQVNITLIPNSYKILNTQLDNDIALDKITPEEGENIKKEFALTYHATNKIKELKLDQPSNIKIINLIKEREALTTKIKVVDDPTLTTIQSARVKELNVDIEGVIKTYAKTEIEKGLALSEKSLLDTGEKVYEKPLGAGKSFEVFDTADEAQAAYDKWAKENNIESEDIKGNDGFKLPNGQMLINKEQAIEVRALNVAPHELLHNIVDFEFSEPSKAETLKNKFLGTLSKTEREKLDKRILAEDEEGNRLYTDKYLKDSPSEYATQFFELVRNGDITWGDNVKESLIRMWKGIFKPIFEKYGYKNIEFSDGRDIYNFVKDYSKSIEKGTLSTRAKKLLKKGEGFTGVTSFSKTASELKTELANIKENESEYDDPYEYDQEVRRVELELKRTIAKEAIGPTEVVKKEPVKKEVTGKEAKSKGNLQNLLDTKYEGSPKKLASEGLRNTPSGSVTNDFSKSVIGKELGGIVETITRRLYDPIAADAKRGVTRDEYKDALIQSAALLINNEFDPSKQTLDKFISSRLNLRANALAYELGIEGATKGGIKKDAAEEKGLMADETADQGFTETVKEKPKYKNVLEAKVFPAEVLETATKKIITITRTLKSRIDAPITLNRTVTPLISEIRDEVGKQLDIDIKTMLGGKKDGILVKELLRTKRYVLENMTTTWLMGKDGQGGIPMAIQKQIDGRWVNFPDWVGQKIDREKTTTDQAGRTSGAELVRRLPNVANNISDEVFLAQIIGPDGNPIRGRKESLSKAMSEEGAFDIINADLADEGPIFEALATNQERLGYEMANNFAVTFSKQSERGNIKASKTIKEAQAIFEKLDKDVKFTLIGADGSNFTNFIKNVNNEDGVETEFNLAYGDTSFEPEDRNKIVNAIKGIYSFYKKQSGKSAAKTYGINLNEDFESFANRKIFNALSKDQSLALTVNIPSSDLKWKSDTERKAAQVHMKNFYNSAIKNFTENKKMSKGEAQKLFTRLFSRAFSYGKDQSLFNNQQGFFNAFLNKQPGFTIGAGEIRGKTILYKGTKVNYTVGEYGQATSAKDISEFIKTGNPSKINIKERKAISTAAKKDLKILITALKEMYESGQVNDTQLGLIFKSLGGSMNSTLKLASELRYVAEKGNYSSDTKEWVYEHVPPSSYISRIALGIITGKTDTTIDEFMDKLINNSYVTILPKSFDKSVNELYKSNMPFYYEIGDNPLIRYLDAGFNGKETPAFYDLYDEKQINNAIVKDAFSSKIIKDTQEAVLKSLTSYSKTTKGISVFDFDDTVGLTSGSVLYTMPDGTKGKLNAEEFAKEGGNMLDAGAEFDFSEFSKVVDGKPGPMVEKMKKMIGKFGPENFFILTARPANAAGPIHEFLSSIGIDIPLENITGLGSSLAQSKADWMTAKAAEGYNDFYFSDDAIQNVEAVKNALAVLDVKSKIQQALIKFSLTSKQDLKWNTPSWGRFAIFNVNNKEYSITLTDTGKYNYIDKEQKILDNLIKKYNLEDEEANLLGSYEGGTLNLAFGDKNSSVQITGARDAFEVFGTVINGVLDYVKDNDTTGIIFTAAEPSRKKLYNAMAAMYANKLGWNAFYEDGIYIVSKYPVRETTNSFDSQPKQTQAVLNVVDIKSPIQKSRIKFSKTISTEFNKIIEENKGMEHYKVFSDIVARRRGKSKNKFDFYVPPSAADFELLLYNFLGKGERGEEQQRFFNEALLKPYANGNDLMDAARQSIKKDYKALLDSFPDIRKKMETLTPDGDYTYDQAIRVAMWNEEGVEIPGISERDSRKLTDLVNNDPELAAFKQGLIVTGRQGKGWINPTEYWDANTIIADLHGLTEGEGRKKFLAEFIDNAEQMFGTWSQGKLVGPNINKVEAVYGSNVREAIEDVLYRMTTGKNRSQGKDKETSAWSNWVNGSTGAIMFLNTRSAALQLIGAVNFLNLRDNNPVAAGKAFLNQPQYWKDFSRIWNSDKMKERRGGLKEDVAAAEIANAAAGSKNKPAAVIAYLLKIGYTPTQLADSFAIASGGAPFYRNRVKSYLKEGLTEQEAEDAAWSDFTKVSDETQQSGDPRDISKQQASGAGRLLLTFQNTAMQQSRIVKKSYLDLRAGRGNAKTHVSKIIYYLAIQNTLFAVLQQGLFAVAFDDEDEEKDKDKEKAKKKTTEDRLIDVADGVLDTVLRGTGFAGGVVSVLKNMTKKYLDEKDKNFKADYAKVVLEGANISPPIGSKLRKLYTGLQQTKFEKDLIDARGWGVMQDGRIHLGPMYSVTGKVIEATTNVPIDRLVNKIENVSQAMNSENQAWQRVAVGVGFTPYSLGIEESKGDLEIRAKAKEIRKEEGKIKSAETRQRTKDSIRALPIRERVRIKREAALKRREEKIKKRKRKMG